MRDEHQANIGALVAALRERQGWSQRALAKWVGLDQSAVSRIEAGHRSISAKELQRFADAFHVSADVLLLGMPPAGPAAMPMMRTADATTLPPPAPAAASRRAPVHHDLSEDAVFKRPAEEDPGAFERFVMPLTMDAVDRDESGHSESLASAGREATSRRGARPRRRAAPFAGLSGLPVDVASVVRDWFALRDLATEPVPALSWSSGHSADGRPAYAEQALPQVSPSASGGDVLHDRVARFWRSELHVDPDDGPLPDLVPLLEDALGVQVIVARVASADMREATTGPSADARSFERPVAAAFVTGGVPFVFVNAARPVVLQRYALAHAFAHVTLGHGDVVDPRIEWSRNNPREAAANDFAEELLAPVRAVRRWYERHPLPGRSPDVETLLELANAFGISAWAALYRSRAAGRLHSRRFASLSSRMRAQEWDLLPRQAFLGGLRDTLSQLTPGEALPPGSYGAPAVLRVPATMRAWALQGVLDRALSLEDAAGALHLEPGALAKLLARIGLE